MLSCYEQWYEGLDGFLLTPCSGNECRPEAFKSPMLDEPHKNAQGQTSQAEEEDDVDSSDDDGLPPLEANTNRIRPFECYDVKESDSESDSNSWVHLKGLDKRCKAFFGSLGIQTTKTSHWRMLFCIMRLQEVHPRTQIIWGQLNQGHKIQMMVQENERPNSPTLFFYHSKWLYRKSDEQTHMAKLRCR